MRAIETRCRYSFTTFEEYVEERWDMAERTAEQMIQSACAADKVAQLCGVLPNKESHVRELLKLQLRVGRKCGVLAGGTQICAPSFSLRVGRKRGVPAAEARVDPLADHGANQHGKEDGGGCSTTSTARGTVKYTLRRLARDNPKLLDKIEAGCSGWFSLAWRQLSTASTICGHKPPKVVT
jgi:hypothetical protein